MIDAGIVVAIGLPLAALLVGVGQLVYQRAQFRQGRNVRTGAAASSWDSAFAGFELFAPAARIADVGGFLNRAEELRTLKGAIEDGTTVVVIEGVPGAGKTALAAALCRQLPRRHPMRWVFCGEQERLTLGQLLEALAYDPELRVDKRLRAFTDRGDVGHALNAAIRYLARHRIVLVLDDFHVVTDPGLRSLVASVQRSKLRSTIVLTTRRRLPEIERLPLTASHQLSGLSLEVARQFLRDSWVSASDELLDLIWAKAGNGVPQAMRCLVGHTRNRDIPSTLRALPDYTPDLSAWITELLELLEPAELDLAKAIAVVHGPASLDLLRAVTPDPAALDTALDGLLTTLVVSTVDDGFRLHDLYRDHIRAHASGAERDRYGTAIAQYYQRKARGLLLGLGEQPSYGTMYLEAFPDYAGDTTAHLTLITDLVDRLSDNSLSLPSAARVLVLGSGNGIHDPGLTKYAAEVINVDIQPEIARLGRDQAQSLPIRIRYLVADMTLPLPLAPDSVDAVFNIGSSFGYEERTEDNAAIFRHAARVLRPGGVFVFEYANGQYWRERRSRREVDSTTLPNGSIRTSYAIFDEVAGTSLTSICLVRKDNSTGWFHHFMHYYRLSDITAMMRAAGLEPVATYGAKDGRVTGDPFDERHSAAMVILATPAKD